MSLENLTLEQKLLRLEELEAAEAARKAKGPKPITFKVSEKKGLSVYGLGRFPVTLYVGQWERLLGAVDDLKAFIEANRDELAVKE